MKGRPKDEDICVSLRVTVLYRSELGKFRLRKSMVKKWSDSILQSALMQSKLQYYRIPSIEHDTYMYINEQFDPGTVTHLALQK